MENHYYFVSSNDIVILVFM